MELSTSWFAAISLSVATAAAAVPGPVKGELVLKTYTYKTVAALKIEADAYYGYGDVDGPWYTTPSEHYRKQPLVSKEEAYKGWTPAVVTESGQDGLNRGRFYLYLRQNGLWTREVSGFDPTTEKSKLDPYCPVRNITPQYPPIVMLHGTADTDVPCQESLDMAEQLKKNNVRYELFAIPGASHGLGGGDRQMVEKAMARAREFIKETLGSPTR